MNLISDIWLALSKYDKEIIVLILCMGWGSIITFAGLRVIENIQLSLSEYISLALGGWVLPVLPASVLIFGVDIFLDVHPNTIIILVLMVASLCIAIWIIGRAKIKLGHESLLDPFFLALLFLCLLLLRLAFIAQILLPPYFDSAEHYRIIQSLITTLENSGIARGFNWPVSSYYHIGFHIIAAFLTAAFQVNIKNMILVFGQISLAAAPIPLFLIVRHETKSNLAGMFSVILGAFGWYMPAFSANWGKYPAILSLLPIQFTLAIAYFAGDSNAKQGKSWALFGMIFLGICVSFVVHSRSIIILGMVFGAWILARLWDRQGMLKRFLLLGLVIIILIIEAALIAQNPILDSLFDPYLSQGMAVTGLIGLFSVAAFLTYPRLTFSALLTIALLLIGLYLPIPIYSYTTLLDRPLVEMLLFMPLAVLGGSGFAGMITLFYNQPNILKVGSAAILSGAIIFHALTSFEFRPSDCCSLVKRDDVAALDWMGKNLPEDVRILIPSSNLVFSASSPASQDVASDAGGWILPLTGRQTISLLYGTDFSNPGTLETICKQEVSYIYIGSTRQSFGIESLNEKPAWYKLVLYLPMAKVYRVTGCTN